MDFAKCAQKHAKSLLMRDWIFHCQVWQIQRGHRFWTTSSSWSAHFVRHDPLMLLRIYHKTDASKHEKLSMVWLRCCSGQILKGWLPSSAWVKALHQRGFVRNWARSSQIIEATMLACCLWLEIQQGKKNAHTDLLFVFKVPAAALLDTRARRIKSSTCSSLIITQKVHWLPYLTQQSRRCTLDHSTVLQYKVIHR